MGEANGKDNDQRREEELPPTASFASSAMRPGRQIGVFRIERELGRGGMGVVYLAHDTKLDRPVAIKSLPAEMMRNPLVRKRWKREARLLASLNHPNIGTLYEEIEEAEELGYLVLEYVPGRTLAEQIAHRGLKSEEALSIALQIAEAVAAAHEHGVVHRDLKPGNIKITPEGKVKVLDFGLAKAITGGPSDQYSTTTELGKIMGTPAYMSPEQARGSPVDNRSDIWSFGCVLYEILTGRVPFKGETTSDTLANILKLEPDWQALPQGTPANIQVLLRRCLEKDPRQRLQHIGDARIEIRETLNLPATAPPVTTASSVLVEPEITARARSRRIVMMIGAAIIVVLCVVAVRFILQQQAQPPSQGIRLVVLPFENLGSTEDEYFASGITDAITARLAVIRGLGVISRQSAMQYKQREKSAQQIAKELGVDYILEGTVRRERSSDPTSKIRIIPQLIRASDDTHVWAATYDNDMSEVFQVQSDLAERVAQALDVTVLEPERRALKARPTDNIEAYEYYLRSNEYFPRSTLENDVRISIQMCEKAVELDPRFALAYTRLSTAHAGMYWFYYDRSEERLRLAKQSVDKALQLNPNLPEAHIALGYYYYWGHLDYDRALEQFTIARRSQPNNSELLRGIGFVQRRQGKIEKAAVTLEKALELDPRSAHIAFNLGETFLLLRRYPEAERYCDRAVSLAPDSPRPYAWKAHLYLLSEGNTEKARAVLEQASQNIGYLEDRFIILWSVWLDAFDGNYQEALAQLSSCNLEVFESQFYFIPKAQLCAQINGLMGNQQLEHDYYDSARKMLETKVQERPEDARFHSALGIAYAGLGRKEDAIREGKLAVKLLPVSKEAYRGLYRVEDLAKIYVMVGEFDAAVGQLEFLLSVPSYISIPLLQLARDWGALRDHPRFQKLVEAGK